MKAGTRRYLPRTGAAVLATAVLGSVGTDVRSRWYADLRKPSWQPPGWVFGPAWTTLYALIAASGARVMGRADARERRGFSRALAANLALNTAWSWVFFTAKRPRWALVESVALEASTLDLVRRARGIDPVAATMLAPYAGWVGFATALTGAVARDNT